MKNKNITRLLPLLGLFCLINPLSAQQLNVPEFIEWNEFCNTMKLSDKFGLYTEVQLRFVYNDNQFQTLQHQFRVAPEIYVDKHLAISPVAFVYTINNNYEAAQYKKPYANDECRVYSQMVYKHHIGRVHMQHRLRYEWRFTAQHTVTTDSLGNSLITDDGFINYKNRIRYRLSANIPINNKTIEPKTWYIRVWDEIAVAFADLRVYPTFKVGDNLQHRAFIGVGYQIIKPVSITLGFLYQMQTRSTSYSLGPYVEHNFGTYLSFNFTPDLSNLFKKKKKE